MNLDATLVFTLAFTSVFIIALTMFFILVLALASIELRAWLAVWPSITKARIRLCGHAWAM